MFSTTALVSKIFGWSPPRLLTSSLALRIAVSSALFGLVVIAAGGGVAYWALSDQLDRRIQKELIGKRGWIQHVLSEQDTRAGALSDHHRYVDGLLAHEDLHLALTGGGDNSPTVSFSPIGLEALNRLKNSESSVALYIRWRSQDGARFASISDRGSSKDGLPIVFVLTQDLTRDRALLNGFMSAALIALPLMLSLVALGAWFIARISLAPLKKFTRLTSSISSDTLNYRMSVDGLPEELRELARDLNAMLHRIDEGMTRLAEFSGNLAHEMSTPVATMLGRSQMMLSRARSREELHELAATNIDELDRLARLIGDMLFLAQTEAGDAIKQGEKFELRVEVLRVVEYLAPVADDFNLRFDVIGQAAIVADRLLVQRAITNLLTNAIRHAFEGTSIEIEISIQNEHIELCVRNTGISIPIDELERIFKRFHRADPSRRRFDGGSGLGLAIVRSIMQSHHGTVTVSSEAPGLTTFTLSFPLGTLR